MRFQECCDNRSTTSRNVASELNFQPSEDEEYSEVNATLREALVTRMLNHATALSVGTPERGSREGPKPTQLTVVML